MAKSASTVSLSILVVIEMFNADVVVCRGASDDQCIAQGDVEVEQVEAVADEVVQEEEKEEEQEERLAGAVEGTAPQERRWGGDDDARLEEL
ncbi:hypothetical protein HYQ44_003424 [Verticillium longisporum]|nr:hypothetical protein HYQ44_003424 [Verticillium longisporum]